MTVTAADARAWLDAFAAAVRSRDTGGGRPLFDGAVIGYGTRTARAVGLDQLVSEQWSPVWSATTGFVFDEPDLLASAGDEQVTLAARWESRTPSGGIRSGRSTLVLRRNQRGDLVCAHSHFSLDPADGGSLE